MLLSENFLIYLEFVFLELVELEVEEALGAQRHHEHPQTKIGLGNLKGSATFLKYMFYSQKRSLIKNITFFC